MLKKITVLTCAAFFVLSLVSSALAAPWPGYDLKVDFALPQWDDNSQMVAGTAKAGWVPFGMTPGDMWTHDPRSLSDAGGTGININVGCGYGGNTAIHVLGMVHVGDGAAPGGAPTGDPIANSYVMNARHWGEPDGDILLTFNGLAAGEYSLESYHNDTGNPEVYLGYRLTCVPDGFDVMPSITVSGDGVSSVVGATDVPIQHVIRDMYLNPSLVTFSYDGNGDVVVRYISPPGFDRCEGGTSVLNAFHLVPEPATIMLLGLGGLALIRRKR